MDECNEAMSSAEIESDEDDGEEVIVVHPVMAVS